MAPLGVSSWMRTISASNPEMMKNNKPATMYWTPMILASIEKTYFAMKLWGSGWDVIFMARADADGAGVRSCCHDPLISSNSSWPGTR